MLLLLATLVMPQDTIRLAPLDAFSRAVELHSSIVAADAGASAAELRARVSGRLDNPTLSVLAENLGMQERLTGRRGLEGTEGQIVLSIPFALGGDRGARRSLGVAESEVARVHREQVVAAVGETILLAMIDWERERALLAGTTAERDALTTLAEAMTARAREGRDAASDAALARLEADAARSRDARQRAAAAAANARLAAFLDLPIGSAVDILPLACTVPPQFNGAGRSPESRRHDAAVKAADASARLARAAQIPDLHPELGLRRSDGFSGLLLGLSLELPVWGGGGTRSEAASWDSRAVEAERAAATRAEAGEIAAHQQARAALLAGASRRDSTWLSDLDAVVVAEERRLAVGEGSLFRLFDARRSRLAALTEHEAWRDAVRRHQVALARRGLAPLSPAVLCLPEVQP